MKLHADLGYVMEKVILHRLMKITASCQFFWHNSIPNKTTIVLKNSHEFHCDVTTQWCRMSKKNIRFPNQYEKWILSDYKWQPKNVTRHQLILYISFISRCHWSWVLGHFLEVMQTFLNKRCRVWQNWGGTPNRMRLIWHSEFPWIIHSFL